MLIVLKVNEGRIVKAQFSTYGCPAAAACGQFVTEQAEGKTQQEAEGIEEAHILAAVGHMPLGREHCPALAVKALRNAAQQMQAAQQT